MQKVARKNNICELSKKVTVPQSFLSDVGLTCKLSVSLNTVNGERFAGLNFRGFHSFLRAPQKFSCEYLHVYIMALLKYCETLGTAKVFL